MKILFLDTECNSLDTENGFIQELAWVIADSENWRTIKATSHLLSWKTFYPVDPGALAVTGLTREYCEQSGRNANSVISDLLHDACYVDAICGHNIMGYDLPMLATNVKRACFYPFSDSQFAQKLIIDTLTDCPYPSTTKIHALKYLAYDHGFILSDAHQALADVFACKHLLTCYDLNQVVEIAKTPLVTLTTQIDFNDLDSRERVKQARFYWNGKRKVWEKRIREFHLPGIQLTLGNNISLLKEVPSEVERHA